MNPKSTRLLSTPEGWLIVLLPLMAIVIGGAMIHVASDMGFTALGENAITAAAATDRRGG